MSLPAIQFRPLKPDERQFVKMSWFESYRKGGFSPDIGYDLFRPGMDERIDRLLQESETTVACPTEVPEEICGYLVQSRQGGPYLLTIHYVYVKQAYRRLGLASALIQVVTPSNIHTHDTRAGRILARKFESRFNPFLIES